MRRTKSKKTPVALKLYWRHFGCDPANQLTADLPDLFPVENSTASVENEQPVAEPPRPARAPAPATPPVVAAARMAIPSAPEEPTYDTPTARPSTSARSGRSLLFIGLAAVIVAGGTAWSLWPRPEARSDPAGESAERPLAPPTPQGDEGGVALPRLGPKLEPESTGKEPPVEAKAAPKPEPAKKITPPIEPDEIPAGVVPEDVTADELFAAIRFTQGPRAGTTRNGLYPVYWVTLRLELTPAQAAGIRSVTYEFHHPDWVPPVKRGGSASKGFPITWDGYGCNIDVTVTAKLRSGASVERQFNLCSFWKMTPE